MKVDYTDYGKATCRVALQTYEKALELHRREADRLGVSAMSVQIIQGRVEQLKRLFSEQSKARTIDFGSGELRVTMVDALTVEHQAVEKLTKPATTHLVDLNDVERQLLNLTKLKLQLNDQVAMELEVRPAVSVERNPTKANGAAKDAPNGKARGRKGRASAHDTAILAEGKRRDDAVLREHQ